MKDCWLYNNCNHKDCDKDFCMRYYKLNYLYEQSLITQSQRKHIELKIDADGTDKDKFNELKQLENNIEDFVQSGSNLYIHSTNCGNGKTSWTLRLAESYINKIWAKSALECRVLFINVPKFLLSLKDNISDKNEYISHIKNNVEDCDLVIWDDIGTKLITSFEGEHLFRFISERINNNKSNIFTSNLNNEELHDFLGDRLSSRICNESINIEFKGKDKRNLVLNKK